MRYRQWFLANFSKIITLYLWGMISSFPHSHHLISPLPSTVCNSWAMVVMIGGDETMENLSTFLLFQATTKLMMN
ncbi:hypothetical protein Bca4012_096200 [Brassica carinata]|uniref:(rape) hypothetical protein n=1 Tax=Brassica napus TaxID=3708 RepID=A0A816UQK5_BRANA|nr:unnamed protein product [Brassica napus]